MALECQNDGPRFYRPRDPRASPLYQLVERDFDEFERVYPERYQERYGFWRPVIRDAVNEYLKCGDLHEGFARVRCTECGHDMFVAFSCKQRCVCPSCHQKRTLVTAINIAENIAAPVPHRQFVFTMPKRFRLYFRFNRELLRKLPVLAWRAVLQVYRAVLDRDDVTPGMIVCIQTFGELAHWHPHIHALVSDGALTRDGTFVPLPDISAEPFLKLWEKALFDLLLAEGRITEQTVEQMRSWQHSGFSVDKSVKLEAGDTAAIERLVQYMVRCPFSLDRIISVGDDGKVVYRAEKQQCRPFPMLGNAKLLRGISRNFEVFDPLDFLAEITQHIPDPGMQMIRYYGWYSNRARGDRARSQTPEPASAGEVVVDDQDTPYRKLCRMRWSALIKRVFEVDPLRCEKCGGEMKIVSFIEPRDQPDVVERILRHCNLWNPPCRAPPEPELPAQLELEYVSIDDFAEAL